MAHLNLMHTDPASIKTDPPLTTPQERPAEPPVKASTNRLPPKIDRTRLGVARSFHRKKQDQESHRDQTPPPTPLDHPLVPKGAPIYVNTNKHLAQVLETVREAGIFAFDTEFIGETHFHSRLCLVQISTPEAIWLIDPLNDSEGKNSGDDGRVDLLPFWELVADPSVEKILHAAMQDLEPVIRLTGKAPRNIFDTQVAAAFVGLLYPAALGRLVEALAGIELDPGAKFSQWDRRPLTPMQQHYAANDVRYLHLLRDEINQRLTKQGRQAWSDEERALFENPELYRFDPQTQKLKGVPASKMTRRQRHVLKHLVDWRAMAAIEQDVPTRVLLPDMCLGEIARERPATPQTLAQIKGIPKVIRDAYGQEILAVVAQASEGDVPKEKFGPRFDEDKHGSTLQRVWAKVGQICEDKAVAQALAVNKNEVVQFVVNPDRQTRLKNGWRAELFGKLLSTVTCAGHD